MRRTLIVPILIAAYTFFLTSCPSNCSQKEKGGDKQLLACARPLQGSWEVVLALSPEQEQTKRAFQQSKGFDPFSVTMEFDLETMNFTKHMSGKTTEEAFVLAACTPDSIQLVSRSGPEAAGHSATITFVNPDEITLVDETKGKPVTLIRVDRKQEPNLLACARRIHGTWQDAALAEAGSMTFDLDKLIIIRQSPKATKEFKFRVKSCSDREMILEPLGPEKARFTYTISIEDANQITVHRGMGIEPMKMVRRP